jgi:hypothetical protein
MQNLLSAAFSFLNSATTAQNGSLRLLFIITTIVIASILPAKRPSRSHAFEGLLEIAEEAVEESVRGSWPGCLAGSTSHAV